MCRVLSIIQNFKHLHISVFSQVRVPKAGGVTITGIVIVQVVMVMMEIIVFAFVRKHGSNSSYNSNGNLYDKNSH